MTAPKPTFVILHGWGLSQERFHPLVVSLKERHHNVFILDFPGFGKEPMPTTPWTITDYAHFLYKTLHKHNIEQPILIGHSFGGRVSLRYSLLYPKSVRALILTGTPGFTPTARKKLIFIIALAKVGKFIFSLPVLSLFFEKIQTWYYYRAGAREFSKTTGSMKETFKNVVREPLINDMEHVSVPTLLVWGEEDIIVPVKIAQRMKETIANSELVIIPASDHGVPFKNPETFSTEVEKFVKHHDL